MKIFTTFLAGIVFGLGLMISGMSDPAKVLAFLDLSGDWDPSLALVMVGAISIASIGFRLARQRETSLLGLPMQRPGRRPVDKRLVVGSMLFGVGWGLAGICPGPALVLLGSGIPKGLVFTVAMLGGMSLFERIERIRQKSD